MKNQNRILAVILAFTMIFGMFSDVISSEAAEVDTTNQISNASTEKNIEEDTESVEQSETTESEEIDEPEQFDEGNSITTYSDDDMNYAVTPYANERVTYAFSTVADFKAAFEAKGNSTLTYSGEKITKLTITNAEGLILLSNTDPKLYQSAEISTSFSALGLDLTKTTTINSNSYIFQGLGSVEYPFQGKLVGDNWPIWLNHALFTAVSNVASYQPNTSGTKLSLTWVKENTQSSGEESVIFADNFIFDMQDELKAVDASWNLAISAQDVSATVKTECVGGVIGSLQKKDISNIGKLSISVDYTGVQNKGKQVYYRPSSTSAGLICNTLEAGTLRITSLTIPDALSVTVSAPSVAGCSAGGIVGKMAADTTLSFACDLNLKSNFNVDSGQLADAAGGLIGNAQNINLKVEADKAVNINACSISGYTRIGGIVGNYVLSDATKWNSYTDTNGIAVKGVKLSPYNADSKAGGIIGVLSLNGARSFTVNNVSLESTLDNANGGNAKSVYGGLIGLVAGSSATILSQLYITNTTVKESGSFSAGTFGGILGQVGRKEANSETYYGVYVEMSSNVKADIVNSTSADVNYGGLAGKVCDNSVMKMNGVEVNSNGKSVSTGIPSGGLIGSIGKGAALYLTGQTNLSNFIMEPGVNSGQLVGQQNGSLIYADSSWTYVRSTTPKSVDDIGNYGQILRLSNISSTNESSYENNKTKCLSSDLIAINDDHKVKINATKSYAQDLTICSADDFARLAITIQSEKAFSGYTDNTALTSFNTNIRLGANIDLSGTGLIGFQRDDGSGSDSYKFFTGKFLGGSKSIALAIGEVYGKRSNSSQNAEEKEEGSGQIYRHLNLGLFSYTKSAKISDLTLDGSILYGSNGASSQNVGAVTAVTGSVTLEKITVNTSMSRVAGTGGKNSNAGGMIGSVMDASAQVSIKNSTGNAVLSEVNTSYYTVLQSSMIGWIEASDSTITFDGVTVAGSISYAGNSKVDCGGLIAETASYNWQNIHIGDVDISGLKIESKTSATTSGGFLGYLWLNSNVTFEPSSDKPAGYGLTIDDSSISITSSTSTALGGLVYQASGYWNVKKNGIQLKKLSIDLGSGNGAMGLLACKGEALYLELSDYQSYTITETEADVAITSKTAIFDELVAYTASSADTIEDSGKGIISIATEGHALLGKGGAEYTNRTIFGKSNETNGCSRYYYNLDQYRQNLLSESKIDSPEELLLASVAVYAQNDLKKYFRKNGINKFDITGEIDLTGYSYYPVTIGIGTDFTAITDAVITFDNQGMETICAKKTTSGNDSIHTQHYLMHYGLFLEGSIPSANGSVVTFPITGTEIGGTTRSSTDGTVSGALFGRKIQGNINNSLINYLELAVTNLKLNDLVVTPGTTDYAPLLFSQIGSYTTFRVTNLTCKPNGYQTGATSLIGDVGGESAQSISLAFSKIKLEGNPAKKQFTKAILLNSFQYQDNSGCVGIYNFNYEEDWNGTTHSNNVTYGKEIYSSTEYPDQENMYYNTQSGNIKYVSGTSNNLTVKPAAGGDEFQNYLPYVRMPYDSTTYHEIRVNIYVPSLIEGCGTYLDPYKITDAKQLEAVARYIKTANAPANMNWEINVNTSGDSSTDTHVKYQFTGTSWYQVSGNPETVTDTVLTKDMREYLRNAYYQISKNITLGVDFVGLGGTDSNAFRGVLTGDTGDEVITIESTTAANGLINYSYGSVVKDLSIFYTNTENKTTKKVSATNSSDKMYYGGVIGRVYGGDNIIDHVAVQFDKRDSSTYQIELDGTYKHLIATGGYVGLLEGGGVIFRNMKDENSDKNYSGLANSNVNLDISSTENYFYVNPYIGRVLNGYAFYENSTKETINNTNKNYKINTLDPATSSKLSVAKGVQENNNQFYTLTVSDAQQLLILSAIVNSGASAGGETYAFYHGDLLHGKVRNASYNNIGNSANEDYKKAFADEKVVDEKVVDATNAPNVPYLISAYTVGSEYAYKICASNTRNDINLTINASYDMSDYGNGYRAIGARYKSTATQKSVSTYVLDRESLYVNTLNGNNAQILMKEAVNEYREDNYPANAVGGLFNSLQADATASINNLYIGNNSTNSNKSEIKFTYYNGNQTEVDRRYDPYNIVGVGGFAGKSAKKDSIRTVTFDNVQVRNIAIKGSAAAGGILGCIGVNYDRAGFSDYGADYMALDIQNCGYDSIEVKAEFYAAGLIGVLTGNGSMTSAGNQTEYTNIHDLTMNTSTTSTIQTTGTDDIRGVSPMIGRCNAYLKVKNVKVTGNGFIGKVNENVGAIAAYTSGKKITVIEDSTISDFVACGTNVGAIFGYCSSTATINNCVIQNNNLSGSYLGTGKISKKYSIGAIFGINASSPVTKNSILYNNVINGTNAGAIAGTSTGTLYGSNVLWKDNRITGTGAAGIWCGDSSSIYLIGVSRQLEKSGITVPAQDVGNKTYDKYSGYIVYGDYTGVADMKSAESEESKLEYVITDAQNLNIPKLPKTNVTLVSKKTEEFTLYGDGVASSNGKTIAEIISTDAKNHSTYPKAYENNLDAAFVNTLTDSNTISSVLSTYAANQTGGQYETNPNFPVLVVNENSLDNISKYLDVVTNGGYSKAVDKNDVEVTAAQYYYDGSKFQELNTGGTPALTISKGDKNITYGITSEYDNDRNRFTLLSVTFEAKDETYTVYIPIIVKRVLEMDFMATMTYGSVFDKDSYQNLTQHVLESYGNTVSVLLTYNYNHTQGQYVEYGWQSYLDNGGNLNNAYGKKIVFQNSMGDFPKGTQFTLVDCQNADHSYTYELDADTTDKILSLSLGDFVDSENQTFQNATFGELFGATAAEDEAGAWIETDAEKAKVKTAEGKYYKLAEEGEEGTRYTVTVTESEEKDISENYYLLITIPQSENATSSINGKISSELDLSASAGLPPYKLTQVRRANHGVLDDNSQTNTESTYSFLNGYQMNLEDLNSGGYIQWRNSNTKLTIDLNNEISFDNRQVYIDADMLYLQYQTNVNQILGTESSNMQFPAGVNGTASFYVYLMNGNTKTYYTFSGGTWTASGENPVPVFASYDWMSSGENMKLIFGTENSLDQAVSLSGIRKTANDQGLDKLYVDVKMELTVPDGAAQIMIPASAVADNSAPTDYMKLNYRTTIATEKTALSYSNSYKTLLGNKGYYREAQDESNVEFLSNDTSELGINCTELSTANPSIINTTLFYDLSKVNGIASQLQQSTAVSLRFRLEKKNSDGKEYSQVIQTEKSKAPEEYIKLYLGDSEIPLNWSVDQSGYANLVISKDTYANYLKDNVFSIPIRLEVNTGVKEYSNYRVRVYASLIDGSTTLIKEKSDYITYTLARVFTDGFWKAPTK